MPIRLIPNQLVKLYKTQDFNTVNKRRTQDYRQYCQLVREEQTTMFQVEVLPDSENLVTNGDFQNDISGWNIINIGWEWASGALQGENENAARAQIQQYFTVTAQRVHVFSMTVRFISTTAELTVTLANGTNTNTTSQLYSAADYGTQPFVITLFWNSQSDTTVYINFLLDGNIRDLVYIDDVSMYRSSAPVVTLETCTGDLVETLTTFAQSGNVAVFAVEWFGKPEGCYRICLEDTEDTEANYLDAALALGTEGGNPIELEHGGYLKWFG